MQYKIIKYFSSFIAIFLFTSFVCQKISAQEKKEEESFNKYHVNRLAKYAFKTGNYYTSIDLFKKYETANGKASESSMYIAESYFALRQYANAIPYYREVYSHEKENPNSIVKYKYGLSLKFTAKYDEAKGMFNDFIKIYKGSDLAIYQARVKKDIADCNFSLESNTDSIQYFATQLDSGINSRNSDFAPRPYKDKLIYSSLPANESLQIDENNPGLVRLYLAEKNKSGNWERHEFAEGPFNTVPVHTANGSFSSDGKKFYFTRCAPDQRRRMICAIYMSEKRGNTWNEPILLGPEVNNPLYTSTQPYSVQIKKDEVLFFVSDRPGGMGGKDIYAISHKAGKYTELRNLGNKINTSGDELTPFYDAENQNLYFSSDGWNGYGGLDIYKAKGIPSKWKEAKNAGLPFNSSTDDYYFIQDSKKNEGYFVSNRPEGLNTSGCCDDIYLFKPLTEKPAEVKIVKDSIKEIVKIEPILIQEADTDRVDFSALKKIEKIETNVTYTLNKIYFDFDDVQFTEEGKEELDKLYSILMQHPSYVIELSAHTDSRGSDEYNVILSQKRAESVKKYLLRKGIPHERLIAKGYGESMPVADNENEDGSDNHDGRKKNRRTEFRILSGGE